MKIIYYFLTYIIPLHAILTNTSFINTSCIGTTDVIYYNATNINTCSNTKWIQLPFSYHIQKPWNVSSCARYAETTNKTRDFLVFNNDQSFTSSS